MARVITNRREASRSLRSSIFSTGNARNQAAATVRFARLLDGRGDARTSAGGAGG